MIQFQHRQKIFNIQTLLPISQEKYLLFQSQLILLPKNTSPLTSKYVRLLVSGSNTVPIFLHFRAYTVLPFPGRVKTVLFHLLPYPSSFWVTYLLPPGKNTSVFPGNWYFFSFRVSYVAGRGRVTVHFLFCKSNWPSFSSQLINFPAWPTSTNPPAPCCW